MNSNGICRYFSNGSCRNGNNCKFQHVNPQSNQGLSNPYNQNQGYSKPGFSNQGHQGQGYGHGQGQGHSNIQNKNFNYNPNFNQPKFKDQSQGQSQSHNQGQGQGQKKKLCTYFSKPNGCKNGQNCPFLHNYHESLHHIKNDRIHNDPIVGCVAIGN